MGGTCASKSPKRVSLLQGLDLNLIRVFDAIYVERGVTRAGERLNLTPSAVSHSLSKLRFALNDELFTRSPKGMLPTPRADDIANKLRVILPLLDEALDPAEFSPATAQRTFTIACVPYLNSTFIPYLSAAAYRVAPKIRLEFRTISGNPADGLDAGELNLAIGGFRRTPPRFVAEELFKETPVWVIRRDHPLVRKRMTLRALASIPHVDIRLGSAQGVTSDSYVGRDGLELLALLNNLTTVDESCLAGGFHRAVPWVAPDSLTAMAIVKETDSVCLVPRRFARRFAHSFGLATFEAPYSETEMAVQMIYSRHAGSQPAVRWLLELIRHLASELKG
jgi:DNA-binding transcriptional LysR family regulator